jgi:protein-tyrosine phosphatase
MDALRAWLEQALREDWPAEDLPVSQLDDATLARIYETLDETSEQLPSSISYKKLGSASLTAAARNALEARATWPGADIVSFTESGAGAFVLGPNPMGRTSRAKFLDSLWASKIHLVVALAEPPWLEDDDSAPPGGVSLVTDGQEVERLIRQSTHGHITLECELRREMASRPLKVIRFLWPDFAAPAPEALAALVRDVAALRDGAPIAVHCGAGIGRSGTFALAAAFAGTGGETPMLRQALYLFVTLRTQRHGAIETPAQFVAAIRAGTEATRQRFCQEAIVE